MTAAKTDAPKAWRSKRLVLGGLIVTVAFWWLLVRMPPSVSHLGETTEEETTKGRQPGPEATQEIKQSLVVQASDLTPRGPETTPPDPLAEVSLRQRERRLATTFTLNRRDGRDAESVVQKLFPQLYNYASIEEKTLKSEKDLQIQEKYLASEAYLVDLAKILASKSLLSGSNVGEYARLYALKSVRGALRNPDLATRARIGNLLVQALVTFPEAALSDVQLKNSVSADRMQMYAFIKQHFPEKLREINVDNVHPLCQKIMQAYDENPTKYHTLVED